MMKTIFSVRVVLDLVYGGIWRRGGCGGGEEKARIYKEKKTVAVPRGMYWGYKHDNYAYVDILF